MQQEFFMLSSKDKLWFVDGSRVIALESPHLTRFGWSVERPSLPIHMLGSRKVLRYETLSPDITFNLEGMALGADCTNKSNIQPEDFYTLPELTKLSKRITRKIDKIK